MWTNSISATHPNVIRSGNQIYEKKKFLCQRSAFCFIYNTKNHLFLSFLFFLIKSDPFIVEFFVIFIMGMKPSTSRVCVCVNGQGLAGGDFVRLCPLMLMFGCWVYRFLVLCFCFNFMSFKGKKNILFLEIVYLAYKFI